MMFTHAPHDPQAPILDVRGVCVRYGARQVLDHLTFQLNVGERVAVVGPNGAGKSTLLKAIAGLIEPDEGSVRVFGHRPVGHICIAYLPQRAQVDWNFPITVCDAVMMGRVGALGLLKRATEEDRNFVRECLHRVGLWEMAARQIGELSGGQQQRMFIARSLAMKAELMLMDEPFSGLDLQSERAILEIIRSLAAEKVTVMMALHDLQMAAENCDRVLLLNCRAIAMGAPSAVFSADALREAYGGHAIAVPVNGGNVVWGDSCAGGREHDGDE